MARQRKVQEYAVRAESCDTSSSGFRPRTVQDAGYTLNMAVMGSLEQAVVHHRKANEVIVPGALNSEKCNKNVWL